MRAICWATALAISISGCTSTTPTTTATVQPAAVQDLAFAREVHERTLVLDAHADVVLPGATSRYGDADGSSKVTPAKLRAGGVDAVVMAGAVGPGSRTPAGEADARAQILVELQGVQAIADNDEQVVVVTSVAELQRAHTLGQQALLLGFQNARGLTGQVDAIDDFYDAGVRVFALTHIGHNAFADSSRPEFISAKASYEPTEQHQGLSELGRAAIERINQLGGVVDVSQLSKNATLQAIDTSATPVIASHSNVRALSDVARNLSDDEIDRIAAAGGVIHIAAFTAYLLDVSDPALIKEIKALRRSAGISERYTYPYELYWEIEDEQDQYAFLSAMRTLLGPANIDRLIDHIDYVVARVGVDHVGLATDFNHGGGIEGFQNASEALNVTAGLLRRGYSEAQIGKIWSGNFLRVLGEAERSNE